MEDLIFFALSSVAKNMECWNIAIMERKLLAQHSYIPSFHVLLLNFCIISSSVKEFPARDKEMSRAKK
jgi:hypothetical protein